MVTAGYDDDEGGDELDMENLKDRLVRWGITWSLIIVVGTLYIIVPVMVPYFILRFLERHNFIRFGDNEAVQANGNHGKEKVKQS